MSTFRVRAAAAAVTVLLVAQALALQPATGSPAAGVSAGRSGLPSSGAHQLVPRVVRTHPVSVTARPSVATILLGRYLVIGGTTSRARVGGAVRVQRLVGKRWVVVAATTVTARQRFSVRIRATWPGRVRLRAVSAASAGYAPGTSAAFGVTVTTRAHYQPLAVRTSSLARGTVGLKYLQSLSAAGGTAPYTWRATSLPAGLAGAAGGYISGSPSRVGSWRVGLQVTDADGVVVSVVRSLSVPAALPSGCINRSCSQVVADGATIHVAANQVGSIARDGSGNPTQILLTGVSPTVGNVLVLAPSSWSPSGLIVVVDGVTANADGTYLVDVSRAGPADAYASGTVALTGAGATTTMRPAGVRPAPRAIARARTLGIKPVAPARPATVATPQAAQLSCDSGVSSDLHGLSVEPSLTPSIAALWAHPYFGGGGVYVGSGGLSLFQADLDGTLTVNLGVTVSGSATCTLTLPGVHTVVPAGDLGAVILDLDPSLTFKVSGKIDVRTTVVLSCGVEYRWDRGAESRAAYCAKHADPLQLSADSGLDASVTAELQATVTLDEVAGIQGTIDATIHAGYHPATHPIAVLDGHVDYNLSACLACLWGGSPPSVTLVGGTIWHGTIASYDRAPAPVPASGPPVITTAGLPDAVVGQPYSVQLHTADNRQGAWFVSSGALPDGLDLVDDTITGRALSSGTAGFTISFTDAQNRTTDAALAIRVVGGGVGGGAVQDLSYCRASVLAPNDDLATSSVDLPFTLDFLGSTYSSLYISNNGYVTFDQPSGTYTPYALDNDVPQPIIAPFFADVDTRPAASGYVTYGASPDGHTFCVDWVGVGYYDENVDKLDSFQLLLTDRSSVASGDFDITFNYGPMNWETGDVSGGTGGIGGTVARVGYSVGQSNPDTYVEVAGSGVSGALLDGGVDALSGNSYNSPVAGRYVFPIRN